jgi:hypothetical protein
MYEVWVFDGHYIQGRRVGDAKTPASGVKLIRKAGFTPPFTTERERRKGETLVWVDDADGNPVGVLVQIKT